MGSILQILILTGVHAYQNLQKKSHFRTSFYFLEWVCVPSICHSPMEKNKSVIYCRKINDMLQIMNNWWIRKLTEYLSNQLNYGMSHGPYCSPQIQVFVKMIFTVKQNVGEQFGRFLYIKKKDSLWIRKLDLYRFRNPMYQNNQAKIWQAPCRTLSSVKLVTYV